MLKHPDSTPCPTGGLKISRASFPDDVDEDLSYTTEVKAIFRNAGPRRRTSVAARSQMVATASNAIDAPSAANTKSDGEWENSKTSTSLGLGMAPPRRRVSQLLVQRIDEKPAENQDSAGSIVEIDAPNMRKRPRRRTIYIPPDDTTILTIHPGVQLNSSVLSRSSSRLEHQTDAKLQIQDDKRIEGRCARRVSLAAAPKRVPLQPTLKPLQEMDDKHDSSAGGSGKENVPPGSFETSDCAVRQDPSPKARRVSIFQAISTYPSNPAEPHHHQGYRAEVDRQNTSKAPNFWKSKRPSAPPQTTKMTKPVSNRDRRASMMNRRNSLYYGTGWKAASNPESCLEQAAPCNKLTALAIPQSNMNAKVQYQILEEDIEKPEMYEDAWLKYQEFAIQQLLNGLFEKAHEKVPTQQFDRHHFRGQLLHLYQHSDITLIYKRLHASLLYGALNPPKGSIAQTTRLKTDVGLRQSFLVIWLDTYDLEALMSAVEVVVGRNILPSSSSLQSSIPRSHEDPVKERKRSVGLFIESCLLRNEDAHEQCDLSNSVWCWRRTMLRCLMMVLLLDKAKEGGLLPKNLFQPSSRIKSSGDIVTEILSLISPFLGDGTRPLAHLHYRVHHVQYPLSEYKYGIENLATDFRDGVQLAHLVELLLYTPQSLTGLREDIIVAMPTGEILRSCSGHQTSWPLSQHLYMPCLTPTQKVYNVQIVLSALGVVGGVVGNTAKEIKAEDVVNGHREKTVALLWSLVGTWGLESLVNSKDIQGEIRRLSRWTIESKCHESKTEDDHEVALKGMARYTHLLKQWATAIARRHGLKVSNLTTSFSDGRVFAAILDEYEEYLPKGHLSRRLGTTQLEAKLKDMGCSNAFARIFIHNEQGRVFDRDFTLAALTFLCSRLLGATKRGIAATIIVRAYRRSKIRQRVRQRCVLLRLAHDCRSVYITRNQVIGAARVLQRQWRAYLGQKTYGSTLSQRRVLLARKRMVQTKQEMSHNNVDIWLL